MTRANPRDPPLQSSSPRFRPTNFCPGWRDLACSMRTIGTTRLLLAPQHHSEPAMPALTPNSIEAHRAPIQAITRTRNLNEAGPNQPTPHIHPLQRAMHLCRAHPSPRHNERTPPTHVVSIRLGPSQTTWGKKGHKGGKANSPESPNPRAETTFSPLIILFPATLPWRKVNARHPRCRPQHNQHRPLGKPGNGHVQFAGWAGHRSPVEWSVSRRGSPGANQCGARSGSRQVPPVPGRFHSRTEHVRNPFRRGS